jgi:hypothetical protein
LKHREPNKESLAGEIRQALVALMQLVVYYSIEVELKKSIDNSLKRMKDEKLID